jgi:hypothetical protein
LELSIPLITLLDYKYLPSSLTRLTLQLGSAELHWSFNDDNGIDMINHLPHLSSLGLEIGYSVFVKPGALSSLSRWLSLTKMRITTTHYRIEPPSLEGFVHHGSFSLFPPAYT